MFTKIGVFMGRIEGRLSRAALLLKILGSFGWLVAEADLL
jgi:hypothetical protein